MEVPVTDLLAFTIVGIVTGSIYAVAATGLVVTYTTSGIFNLAHGAIGMFMAFVYWELHVQHGWPTLLALAVVLLVFAPLMGAVIERTLMRMLHDASIGVTLVVTLALLVLLLGAAQSIWPATEPRRLDPFFAGSGFRLFGVVVTYHELTVIIVAGLIAGLLRLFLYYTRVGITMRATVDDRELAGMNGAHPERISQLAWAIGAALASLAGILIAPAITLNHLVLTLLVVNGYAAAMLGRLRSLPLTFAGALILGTAEAYAIGYGATFRLLSDLKPILPTIFLFAVLVFLPQVRLRAGRVVGVRTPRVPKLRESVVRAVVFVAAIGILTTFASEYWLFNIGQTIVLGIAILSLVVLTGYAGQVSLMQMAFVGVGALAMGRLSGDGTILGVLVAAGLAAAFGAVVALPALRLRDLYLALTTLAFALFAEWAFNQPWLFSRGGILPIERLNLFGLRLASERSQVLLVAVVFAGAGIGVLALRRSTYGRRLAAMRDSPIACATLGMNLVAAKTTVFALSAAIAGVAGALYGGMRTSVSATDFVMLQSLFLFLVATIGGINTVTGALLGGAFLALVPELQKQLPFENVLYYGIGLAAIGLARNPNGVAGDLARVGDQIRKLLSQRARDDVAVDTRELKKVAA
jgi:branched-chain amino acid transport system permease protein